MQTIFNVLVDCINSRSIGKFSMIMGVIEGDWLKINKSPEASEAYEESLQTLRNAKEGGTMMNFQYFRDFDLPVHPQFIVDEL